MSSVDPRRWPDFVPRGDVTVNGGPHRTVSVPSTTGELVTERRLAGTVDQRINLRAAVAAARDLLRSTLSGAERGPMVGGIMDTRTGQVFTGLNTEPIGAIHPALEGRLVGVTEPHGEIVALNKALWARGIDAQIDDGFLLYNLRFGKGGIPITRCTICQGVTQGVFPLSDGVK